LLVERGLGDLAVSHSSVFSICRGLWFAARSPTILLNVVNWIFRQCWRNPRQLLKSLILLPRSLDIYAKIRDERPDVVHLFWGHYPAIVGHLVRQYLPDIVLSMFLGAYDLETRYAGSASVAQVADVVWTHARKNISMLVNLGVSAARLRVVHRGIDIRAFSPDGIDKIPHRMITAGRLTSDKGMDDVLAVFARVLSAWPDASLVMLGDGPERSRLASLADRLMVSSKVVFRGHLSHAEVRSEMAAAEIFILMSRSASERLPNVVKEAMSTRCACLVSDTSGIEELIEDGTTGFVVPQGDVDEAARRVDSLFRDRERAAAMVDRAQSHVLANFDVNVSMKLYRDCWKQLLLTRRSRGARGSDTQSPGVAAL
jgi:glycosyltransferase involved in cell wall biosynthesis